jgi:hypothetical protein
MKKLIHMLVLAVFGIGCWFTWNILTLAPDGGRRDLELPAFTLLCVSLRPLLVVLPILVAAYCLWVWFRKSEKIPSWTGFFAVTMGLLVVTTLPAMVAAYLPLVNNVNSQQWSHPISH